MYDISDCVDLYCLRKRESVVEREKNQIKYSERDYSSLLFERQAKPLGYDTGDELTRRLEEQAEWLCGKLLLSFNPSCLHRTFYWGGQGLF